MTRVTLAINGRNVTAAEGTTLLQAATSAGVTIPTLCHHDDVTPFGACRLCTVEIHKGGRTRLVASCLYPVEEGLDVHTESPRVAKGRKMILELLMARAPGVQLLRSLAARYGARADRFDPEPSFCVLCGLCVNYCQEVKGKNAMGFIGRGVDRQVMFFGDTAANECLGCAACMTLCPTGVWPSNYGLARVPHLTWPASPFAELPETHDADSELDGVPLDPAPDGAGS